MLRLIERLHGPIVGQVGRGRQLARVNTANDGGIMIGLVERLERDRSAVLEQRNPWNKHGMMRFHNLTVCL